MLPPLRDRPEDIPELVEQFFERSKQKHKRDNLSLPPMLLPYFQQHSWPGNVRELENAIARIVLLARGTEVTLSDVKGSLSTTTIPRTLDTRPPTENIGLDSMERAAILEALRKFEGNQSSAARHLQISRKVLMNRVARYKIQKEEIRARSAGQG